MTERLAEILVVVIPGHREDRAPVSQKLFKRRLQVSHRLTQAVGPRHLAEDVPGDEQHVHPLLPAIIGNVLDPSAQIVRAVDPAQTIAEMPVCGVQKFHCRVLCRVRAARVEVSS